MKRNLVPQMHRHAFAHQPNRAVKRTPTRAMASPFSWPLLLPSAPSVLRRRLPRALGDIEACTMSVKNEPTTPALWTHRAYFERFRLNVEQYGEILVAHAFRGEKKGDAQPCYDVEATEQDVRTGLLATGESAAAIDSCFATDTAGVVRIEVKCKLAVTPTGKANVIHCRNKLKGVRHHLPATHFAVVLFNGGRNGTVEHAWFFTTEVAKKLQQKETKSGYIPVAAVRKAAAVGTSGLIDIRTLIETAASSALSLVG